MHTTSTVGLISSSISSVGLYAMGDSSSVPVHTDDEYNDSVKITEVVES